MKKFQSKKSLKEELIVNLRQEMRTITVFTQTIGKSMGLQLSDIRCLDYLIKKKSATAGRLANITGLTTGAVTAMIRRLEKSKLIRRQHSPEDKRKTIIVLAKNKNFLPKTITTPFLKDINKLLDTYTTKELSIINDWNIKMTKLLQNKIKKIKK